MHLQRISHYIPLPISEGDPQEIAPRRKGPSCLQLFLWAFMISVSGSVGYLLGSSRTARASEIGALPLALETHTFQYNRSFSYPPSEHTNRAWREIFPAEGGFFVHPTIAPTRSTFSVFHQLHCLNGLRGGYWANQRAASAGEKISDEDLPVDIQTSHMRHCIDLLRQVLMCHGDTTPEVVDEEINGVHGFRTPHTCVDWEQLKTWTSTQQAKQHVEQIV
ncbi:hypothetical protein F5883DRAFT_129171 [Diaporthe sp. PMI_573]|nr:hypothetical protein F5883DRAFT_129171 [Diaporthaceae sp. PMI_573]